MDAAKVPAHSGVDCGAAGVHNAHHEHINLIGHHDINLRAGPRHGNHRPLRLPAELDTLLKRAATNKTATNA